MTARRILIAVVLPLASLLYACGSGGAGTPGDFDLGFGNESKTGGFGANGGVSTPGPSFGVAPTGSAGGHDGGTTEGGTDTKIDTGPPRDTGVAFDAAGFDTSGFDTAAFEEGF